MDDSCVMIWWMLESNYQSGFRHPTLRIKTLTSSHYPRINWNAFLLWWSTSRTRISRIGEVFTANAQKPSWSHMTSWYSSNSVPSILDKCGSLEEPWSSLWPYLTHSPDHWRHNIQCRHTLEMDINPNQPTPHLNNSLIPRHVIIYQ